MALSRSRRGSAGIPFEGGAVAKNDWWPVGPNPADGRAEYTLLLLAVLSCPCSCIGCAGVLATGAKLFLPPVPVMKFAVLCRCTVEKPISAKLPAEDDRWKLGCEGLPGASDMRDPDVERICCPVGGACPKWFCDVERFMAEAGIGIADALLLIGPKVSRGRRTENMPLSCDMVGVCVVVCGV